MIHHCKLHFEVLLRDWDSQRKCCNRLEEEKEKEKKTHTRTHIK
jgi:hypothetical protein